MVQGKPGAVIRLLFTKESREPPGLTSPFDGGIAIKSTYDFKSYEVWRDFGFNPGIFSTKTSD